MPLDIFETDEQELVRLEASPEGSDLHALSKLPVTNPGVHLNTIVELPQKDRREGRIVVFVSRPLDSEVSFKHDGHYEGVVVGGDSKAYPIGGHNISVREEELRRGRRIIP